MDEVADVLRMSKTSIYKRFYNKNSLMEAVCKNYMKMLVTEMDIIEQNDSLTVIKKITSLLTIIGKYQARINQKVALDLRKHCPKLYGSIYNEYDHILRTQFFKYLNEGKRKGVFREDLNSALIYFSFIASTKTILCKEFLMDHPFSDVEALQSLIQLHLHGILVINNIDFVQKEGE